ncbi:MAG: 3'-5' exonuclease, partial [Oscillospiraceae bacterium]
DSKDDLSRCVKMLEGHNFFSEYTVLIDSFMTYMAGEYALINHIVGEAKDTYITFICNSLTEQSGEMGVFSVAVKTARRIIKMAKASAVEVHTPIKLTECPRFENAELAFLQQEYPQQIPEHYPDKVSAIKLVEAKDPYDEIAYVAATICKLVREDGMRYKDIAVIARNLARFGTAVEDIFERYGIPVFADKRDDLLAVPLVRGILAALDAIDKGFETQSLIAFAKSTLMGLSALEVASLENYCYIWNTKGAAWKNEFTANPNGLSDRFSDKDRKQLDEINVTRDKLIKPLITLRETVKSCTGKGFSTAIYSFLTEIHATENMKAYLERNDDISGRYIHLNNGAWEIIMEILNIFARIIGDKTLPTGQYIQLFKNAITASDLGSIPHTLDQTIVGIADRIRPNAPKVTFVIGANEGLFPPIMSENGLFTDIQREELISLGLEISPPAIEKNLYEAYYAYFALTTPSQKLIVSYHTSLLSGEQPKPSIIVQKLKTIFNIEPILTSSLSPEYFVATAKTAFDTACRTVRQNDTMTASVMEAVRKTPYNTNLDKVLSTLNKTPFSIQDRAVSSELFGKEMKLSPSRIEEYYKCPFSLFCNLGLKLKPIRRVEFSPLESGN